MTGMQGSIRARLGAWRQRRKHAARLASFGTIGRGSVVGAGSVVTKSVPAYSVVVGNPARVARSLWDRPSAVLHEEALYGGTVSNLLHLEDGA
ncbi:MAG: hypothetical protein ACYC6C_07235 [Coriobacteriia bacterium]